MKQIHITGHSSLNCFNACNHPIFSNPTLELTNPRGFGVVSQQIVPTRRASSSRWIQMRRRLGIRTIRKQNGTDAPSVFTSVVRLS
jgi:hypothetical protein